jgi:predicted Zn-dependent protease with MMP-like domain
MADPIDPRTFDDIVEWAYSTLPQKIRDLPDFPGIQVTEEPPEGYLKTRKRRTEILGLHVGVHRTERETLQLRPFSDLIFVFRGPILRCSKGDIRAEVKEVVWHEVAHWLGHNEDEVRELGLSRGAEDVANDPTEVAASEIALLQELRNTSSEPGNVMQQQLRCIKCYSADVTCRELDKPLTPSQAWLTDPVFVHAKFCKCGSCGYEWDDEDNG